MLEIARTAHEALGIQSTAAFTAIFALIGALLFGGGAYLVDRTIKKQIARESQSNHGSATTPDQVAAQGLEWWFDRKENPTGFLGLSSSFGEEPYVYLLQFYGKNNTNERLENISGFVQSRSSDTRLPIGINVSGTIFEPEKAGGIPPGAEFAIMTWPLPSNMPNRTGGMTVSRFLVEFAEFTFVLNYNGKQYTRTFVNAEIREPIEKFARERADEAAKQKPAVKPKSASPPTSAPNPVKPISFDVPVNSYRAPRLEWFDGAELRVLVTNTGPVPCSFKATAQILGASYGHTMRHPFKATWLGDEPTGVRSNTAAAIRLAQFLRPLDRSYIYISNIEGGTSGQFIVDRGREFKVFVDLHVFIEEDPSAFTLLRVAIEPDHDNQVLVVTQDPRTITKERTAEGPIRLATGD